MDYLEVWFRFSFQFTVCHFGLLLALLSKFKLKTQAWLSDASYNDNDIGRRKTKPIDVGISYIFFNVLIL